MNTELVVAEIKPQTIEVECGNLRIEGGETGPGGRSVRVLIDGKPQCVKSLTLRIAVDDVVRATMEFYPSVAMEAKPLPEAEGPITLTAKPLLAPCKIPHELLSSATPHDHAGHLAQDVPLFQRGDTWCEGCHFQASVSETERVIRATGGVWHRLRPQNADPSIPEMTVCGCQIEPEASKNVSPFTKVVVKEGPIHYPTAFGYEAKEEPPAPEPKTSFREFL
jgi:hypothetical protein